MAVGAPILRENGGRVTARAGRWNDGWVDGWVDGWINGWIDGWIDGWINGRINGRILGVDGRILGVDGGILGVDWGILGIDGWILGIGGRILGIGGRVLGVDRLAWRTAQGGWKIPVDLLLGRRGRSVSRRVLQRERGGIGASSDHEGHG